MANPIQPALIIGLGGSGIEIVRRFRRRFMEQYPDTPYVRFLGIDTAPQTAPSAEAPQLLDDEFLWAGDFEMPFFVGENYISRFPAIHAWWQGYDHITQGFIAAGAGQRRPVGRLALFVRYDEIKFRLRRHVRNIYSNDSFAALPPQYRRAINVYIVASTCGGTGTGMFLDLAYIARKLVPETVPQAIPWVRGMLLMPSVFLGTGEVPAAHHHQLYANAFGAMAELDFCMTPSETRPPVEYPDGSVDRSNQAFKSCFLLGNQDAQGSIYRRIEDILERGATQLQIELASELTQTGEARIDNVLAKITTPEVQGRSRLYSSFNGDWLELPSSRVISRWTKRYSRRMVERLSAGASTESRGPVAVALDELGKSPAFGHLRAILGGKGIASYLPRVDDYISDLQTIGPDGADARSISQKAASLQADASRQIEKCGLRNAVVTALEGMVAEVDAILGNLLTTSSIADGLKFISVVRDEVDGWLITARLKRQQPGRGWLAEFNDHITDLKAKGIFESKSSYTHRQLECIARALSEAKVEWECRLWDQVTAELEDPARLPQLRRRLDRTREHIDRISSWLPSIATQVARLPEPSVPSGMALESMTDEAIDLAFDDAERVERMDLFARQWTNVALREDIDNSDALFYALWHLANRAVRPVAEDFLKAADIPAREISDRMNRLSPLAVFTPKWQALQGRPQFPQPERLWLIALPERMRPREPDIVSALAPEHRDAQFIRTQGDDRVVMTTQYQGFPLFALAEMIECRNAYKASDFRGRALCFTLPEARDWDIEPIEVAESKLWFAVALATGRIRKVERSYLYASSIDLSGPFNGKPLGDASDDPAEARRRARQEFVDSGLASEVRRHLSNQMRRDSGNQGLCRSLKQWIADQESQAAADPSTYPAEFLPDVALARKYAESISY